MRKLTTAVIAITFMLAMAAPAMAGGGGGSICPGFGEGDEIVMRDNCFAGTAHITADSVVTIRNEGHIDHTYTAVDGSFDTGILKNGESAEISVAGAGLVRVFCTLHGTAQGDGMAGVLFAGESTAVVAAAAPPAASQDPALPAELVAALDRQSAALAELTAQEAALLGRLVTSEAVSSGAASAEWPAPLTVVLLVAALAVVGIFAATRAPGRSNVLPQVGIGEG